MELVSHAVQAQVVGLHVTMPELTTLIGALDRLDDYQQHAKECLRWGFTAELHQL